METSKATHEVHPCRGAASAASTPCGRRPLRRTRWGAALYTAAVPRPATDLTRITTDHLVLDAVAASDLDDLHALHSDPAVWAHLPSGRHTERAQTARDVADYLADWDRDGAGYWTARLRPDDADTEMAFVGIGGVRLRPTGSWHVYYRISPAQQGHGYALEIARAGMRMAALVRPDAPVTAILLEHNHASRITAERLGLALVWRGPDTGNPDPAAVRLIYADRPIDDGQLTLLIDS